MEDNQQQPEQEWVAAEAQEVSEPAAVETETFPEPQNVQTDPQGEPLDPMNLQQAFAQEYNQLVQKYKLELVSILDQDVFGPHAMNIKARLTIRPIQAR
jgi:hypothetical protein